MAAGSEKRPIRARYRLDEETFLQASHALWRKGRRSKKVRVRSAIVLAALPLGAWLAMAYGMWFTFFAIIALALMHFVFDWPLTRAFVRRQFAQLPSAGKTLRWEIDRKGLKVRIDGEEGDWQRIDWEALTDITVADEGFILHQPHNVNHWLPLRAFATEEDLGRFRELVARWRRRHAAVDARQDAA